MIDWKPAGGGHPWDALDEGYALQSIRISGTRPHVLPRFGRGGARFSGDDRRGHRQRWTAHRRPPDLAARAVADCFPPAALRAAFASRDKTATSLPSRRLFAPKAARDAVETSAMSCAVRNDRDDEFEPSPRADRCA
jgi:hypothetical protein